MALGYRNILRAIRAIRGGKRYGSLAIETMNLSQSVQSVAENVWLWAMGFWLWDYKSESILADFINWPLTLSLQFDKKAQARYTCRRCLGR